MKALNIVILPSVILKFSISKTNLIFSITKAIITFQENMGHYFVFLLDEYNEFQELICMWFAYHNASLS
jgi:hypothetical protein